jgi:hypothetical protein
MSAHDSFEPVARLSADPAINRQLELNAKRALLRDQTEVIDQLADGFDYNTARHGYWNPENFSLLWGTPLWREATETQRLTLNHLYWVAYYSQIVSAEIATIFFNQVAAAGLYKAGEDFRRLCDTLDLESRQERAHIHAFTHIGEAVEKALFGERLFTRAMRGPYGATMVFNGESGLSNAWRSAQIRVFSATAPERPTLAAHYLMIRGLRTLNGKMIQERLARFVDEFQDPTLAPAPALVSQAHYVDESFHFNTSRIASHEIPRLLPKPTAIERFAINRAVAGCQRDHTPFSAAINGIFWHDPALFEACWKLFRSPIFGMEAAEATRMLHRCFGEETEAMSASASSHETAIANYRAYVEKADVLYADNRDMARMAKSTIDKRLKINRAALARFTPAAVH